MWIFAQAKYGKKKKENEKIKELNTPKKTASTKINCLAFKITNE